MWWGGRGQSFNIAPQKEEPEMGLSGPKSVQGTGMPEPRSRQLGSCLASGGLPGNNAFPILLISRLFQISPFSNPVSNLTKDTSVFLFRLKVLLPEVCSVLCLGLARSLMVPLFS